MKSLLYKDRDDKYKISVNLSVQFISACMYIDHEYNIPLNKLKVLDLAI